MNDLQSSAAAWRKVQEIRDTFCDEVIALGGDYAAICAVDSREDDRSAVSGVGTMDLEHAHQLVADIIQLLRQQHNLSDEQVIRFLMHIGVEVINTGTDAPEWLS